MDFNLLIAVLGVLVAALAETRSVLRDKHKDQIKSIGLSLLQLLSTLDDIIKTGEKLVKILAETPIEDNFDRTSILPRKQEILRLLETQSKNFQTLADIYQSKLSAIDVNAPKLGSAVEFMIADQLKTGPATKKGTYLKIATWKLLEGELPFSRLSIAARLALQTFQDSTEVKQGVGYLTMRFPEKIKVYEEITPSNTRTGKVDEKVLVEYDLTKPKDLRRLLEKGKNQLQEIKELREQIAQFIKEKVSITDLV